MRSTGRSWAENNLCLAAWMWITLSCCSRADVASHTAGVTSAGAALTSTSVLTAQRVLSSRSQPAINGALTSDGRTLALLSGDSVTFVDLQTRQVTAVARIPPTFALSDGRFLSLAEPRFLRIWDPSSRQMTTIGPTKDETLQSVRVAGETAWVWTGRSGGAPREAHRIEVWDVASNRRRGELLSPAGATAEWLRDDGNVMAIASRERGIRLFDSAGHNLVVLPRPFGLGYPVAWQPRGRALAVGDLSGGAEVWYPERDIRVRLESRSKRDSYLQTDPMWSSDGRRVALFVGSLNAIEIYDAATGRSLAGPRVFPPPGMWRTIFAPVGTRGVGSASARARMEQPQSLVLWDTASGDVIVRISGDPIAQTFSPDGALLAVLERDRHVRVYAVEDGSVVRDFSDKSGGSPLDYVVAVGHHAFMTFYEEGDIGLWDADSGIGEPSFFRSRDVVPVPAPPHSGP